jgi:hypothetical protein
MKECKVCGCKKTWNGDDMSCPYQKPSSVFGANWNCGIINQVRDLCDLAMEGKDYRLHYQYCEDQKYATIQTDCIDDEIDESLGLCLWVTWYKSRGGTDAMWILCNYEPPRKPTFKDLERIVKYYQLNPIS